MARCRCTSGTCTCSLAAGENIAVTGDGSETDPWVISTVASTTSFLDTNEVDFNVTGDGSPGFPFTVSATLPWVDPAAGSTGMVLGKQADGSWAPVPPTTAPAGSVFVGHGLTGDGTAGDPLRLCMTTYDDLKNAAAC
jgi:hypothetical protein